MEQQEVKNAVTINIDSSDWHLGIANVILAMHKAHGLDINLFLDELDAANSKTYLKAPEGQQKHSESGQAISKFLRQLTAPKEGQTPNA